MPENGHDYRIAGNGEPKGQCGESFCEGTPHYNTLTLVHMVGLLITAATIEWFGRKKTMGIEFGVFSLFTFLLLFCLSRRTVTIFIFVARAFISGAFQCAYVYTPEIYPTTLRAVGLGASSAMARFGAITTPFVAQVAAGTSLYIPISVYGVAGLLGLVASLILPIETKGRQMANTEENKYGEKKNLENPMLIMFDV
ncbi:Putative transporter [Toxocara canis]|uniref:Putative transporter n=1 Tax=Toxocara canis TaxID=6265 RepID=A0A0B2VGL1_TOXCA|nr:Putative transporter [Toxocara canis]